LYSYQIKLLKTISHYSSLVPENSKNPYKTRTMRMDYSYTEERYTSLIMWIIYCNKKLCKCTMTCHLLDTQVSRRPMSWSPEITGGLE